MCKRFINHFSMQKRTCVFLAISYANTRCLCDAMVCTLFFVAIILPANCDDELIHLLLIEAIMLPVMVLHLLLHVFDETSLPSHTESPPPQVSSPLTR